MLSDQLCERSSWTRVYLPIRLKLKKKIVLIVVKDVTIIIFTGIIIILCNSYDCDDRYVHFCLTVKITLAHKISKREYARYDKMSTITEHEHVSR